MQDIHHSNGAGGMTKASRGGIAITIASASVEERSRSGSQPRFPYQQQPFQGPDNNRVRVARPTSNDSYGMYNQNSSQRYRIP